MLKGMANSSKRRLHARMKRKRASAACYDRKSHRNAMLCYAILVTRTTTGRESARSAGFPNRRQEADARNLLLEPRRCRVRRYRSLVSLRIASKELDFCGPKAELDSTMSDSQDRQTRRETELITGQKYYGNLTPIQII